jgi:AcrR family transcriptional regulator
MPPEDPRDEPERPYHHGDLRRALVDAALTILERDGAAALSLRAVARTAGVSNAAPYAHFRDKAALLAAVAAVGYRRFAAAMLAEAENLADPRGRFGAIGLGYVAFARANPALFRLMFGPEAPAPESEPDLHEAAQASYRVLTDAVAAAGTADPAAAATAPVRAWALVHGLATLLIDGRLEDAVAAAGGERVLVERVLCGQR